MKTLSNTFRPLTSQELNTLTTIVTETVSTTPSASINKTFNVADLWNIQRKRKSASLRRQYI